jgi:hypothetical protein
MTERMLGIPKLLGQGRKLITRPTRINCEVAILAGGGAIAQSPDLDVPIDQTRDLIASRLQLAAAVASGPAAPFVYTIGASLRIFGQSVLWIIALDVEAAVMQAWTVQSLLEIDRQIRDTVAYTGPMLAKICEDKIALENATRDAFMNRENEQTRARNEARLEAITRVLDDLRSPQFTSLPGKGAHLLKDFDGLRQRVLGGGVYARKPAAPAPPPPADNDKPKNPNNVLAGEGNAVAAYFTPDMLNENWQLAKDLVGYVQIAQQLEGIATSTKTIGVPVNGQRVDYNVTAGTDTHLRLIITNQSADLVYFVRLQPGTTPQPAPPTFRTPLDPSNACAPESAVAPGQGLDPMRVTYALPKATADRWVAVYPEGSTAALDKPKTPQEQQPTAGAGTLGGNDTVDLMQVQLPSAVWLPARLGDVLEVRVATYGPERQKIRWMTLHSPHNLVRPEVSSGRGGGTSIFRGFYYLGFEVAYDLANRSIVRHYSTRESYNWKLTGLWEHAAISSTQNVNELREASNASFPLTLTNDRLSWTLPTDLTAIGSGQALAATVSGQADFAFRTVRIAGPNPGDVPETSKGGDLSILIQVW